MRKVLLSCAVVVAAILVPAAASYHARDVVHTTSNTGQLPDLPAINDIVVVPPASAAPSATHGTASVGSSVPDGSAPVTAPAAAVPGGASYITGSFSTPEPPTCSGMSHSKSTSENGNRVKTSHSRSFCGENDEDDCDDPCDN